MRQGTGVLRKFRRWILLTVHFALACSLQLVAGSAWTEELHRVEQLRRAPGVPSLLSKAAASLPEAEDVHGWLESAGATLEPMVGSASRQLAAWGSKADSALSEASESFVELAQAWSADLSTSDFAGVTSTLVPAVPKMPKALQVQEGSPWHLVSVPDEPDNVDAAVLLPAVAADLELAYAYDGCAGSNPWRVYDPADPAASDLAAVDHRMGVWVKAAAPDPLAVAGTEPAGTVVRLCQGWNLIGYPLAQDRTVMSALSSVQGKFLRVYGFDPGNPLELWQVFDVAAPEWANSLETMERGKGYWVYATEDAPLVMWNVGDPPEVELQIPTDLAVVTAPTEVVGSVTSLLLERWSLVYRAVGEGDWIEFSSGVVPVESGFLGTFDPTLLLNGMYEIKLEARDYQDRTVETEPIAVVVEGQMKIGHFTLEFLDLDLPVSGLDLEVTRRYDSRDKRLGDFGVGWTLAIHQGSLRHNRTPGKGWQIVKGFLPCEQSIETASHETVVRLSELEVYRFTPELIRLAPSFGGCFAEVRYKLFDGPVAGATLEILGNTEVFYGNEGDRLLDVDTLELFEPQTMRFSTRDGRNFDLSLERGVERIEDHNGNSLVFGEGSIVHSSGKTLTFERDAEGRIQRITDPNGHVVLYSYDERGDLVAVTDQAKSVVRFTYDDDHRVLDIEDPLGNRAVRNDYDEDGRLVRTTDVLGHAIEFTHDLDNRREVIRNRLGDVRVLEYDERGNVVRDIDERGKVTLRTFDSRDNKTSETNPLGHAVHFSHDASDNIVEVSDSLSHKTTYTFNDGGQVLTRQDPTGGVQENTFDSDGRLLASQDPLGNAFNFNYDAFGDLTQFNDSRGCTFEFTNNTDGLMVSARTSAGTSAAYAYDANGNRTSQSILRTLADGSTETLTTTFAYDELNRLTRTTFPDSSTTEVRYNEYGLESAIVDELGRETRFDYDVRGNRIRTTYPDNTTEEASYDAEGRRTAVRDRAGRETRFAYDATGNLIETVFPDDSRTTQSYDAAGRLVSKTDERGGLWRFELDAANNVTARIDPLGVRMTFTHDASGNQTSMVDGNGNTIELEYDNLNRLTKTLYADGSTDENVWDAVGRLVAKIDQNGRRTDFEYDCAGRLARVEDAADQVTGYTYDEVGNLIAQTDAEGRTTTFVRDRRGRIVRRVLPLGQAEVMTYDAAGQLTEVTDFNGNKTTYLYDDVGRLITKTYVGVGLVSYTYTPTGMRSGVTTNEGTWSFTYDVRDRLLSTSQPDGRVVAYTYDAAGNRASIITPTGATTYLFDAANRLVEVDGGAGVTSFGYDGTGNRTSVLHGNGTATSFTYDSLDRLIETIHRRSDGSVLSGYAYTVDSEGNRLAVAEQDGRSVSYVYDEVYRLLGEDVTDPLHGAKTVSYTYDRVGNRLSRDEDGLATTYTYDANDRLLAVGDVSFEYDANGNLIRRTRPGGVDVYGYDHENRLIQAEVDTQVVNLTYDDDGLRIRRTVDGTEVTDFLYDANRPLPRVLTESDGTGSTVAEYAHADGILSVSRDGGDFYFHADGQGTTRQLTDAAGAVVAEYGFDGFGVSLYEATGVENDYLYTGDPRDPILGFDYLRARHYSPEQGRFLTTDPVPGERTDPMTFHDYLYAGADPINKSDPSGLFSVASFNVASAVQATMRGIQGSRVFRILRRGLTGKKWDAYLVAQKMPQPLFRGLIKNHYFMYVNKRKGDKGLRYDIGVGVAPVGFFSVVPGILSMRPTRLAAVKRVAARGPWRVGAFNKKQRGIWMMLVIPPGFTDAASAPVKYSFSVPPLILGNPLKGDLWQKVTVNCYTWTAYATGVSFVVSILPIK